MTKIVPAETATYAKQNSYIKSISTIDDFKTDDEWRQARRNGIGGSDIAAIIGLNPWRNREGVRRAKLDGDNVLMNNAMREGVLLESLVIKQFGNTDAGKRFDRIERNKALFKRNDYPYALATPDAFLIAGQDDAYGILEIKTAASWTPQKKTMAHCQLQWYMFVTGAEFGFVACLEQRKYLHWHFYERDNDLIEQMIAAAEEFWNEIKSNGKK